MIRITAVALFVFITPLYATSTSGVILENIDPKVRPQDDLFKHVNGTWLRKTEIPADKTSFGIDGLLEDRKQEQLKAIVESAQAAKTDDPDIRKIGDLYSAFMDEARVNELGSQPILPQLRHIDAVSSKAELPVLFAALIYDGADTPVGAYVHPDGKNAQMYSLDIYQSGLGLPDRDFYIKRGPRFKAMRMAYLDYISTLFTIVEHPDPMGTAARVMAFETQLALAQWSNVQNRDPVKTYNPRTLKNLARQAPGFQWAEWLQALDVQVNRVIVSQPSYAQRLGVLLQRTPLQTIKDYCKLRVLAAYAPYLSQPYIDARFDLRKALTGVQEPLPRWKRGLAVVEQSLGEAMGKEYVHRHFPPEAKAKISALVQNLLVAYGRSIESLDWMSPTTKVKAIEKLNKFNVKVGYPDKWRDYSTLTIAPDDLVGNVRRANVFEARHNFRKLGTEVDRNEWFMTPQTINAYYDPQNNEIVFPAAILQAPYFDPNADDAVNYGAIGAVIGHEITHGFDDEGSQYDGNGTLSNWWTPGDRQRFTRKAAKLVKQYNAYQPVKGQHINGRLTLGENIADLGGLVIAHKAWQISLDGKPAPDIDGLSGDARFFAGFAASWMTKQRDADIVTQLASDPHSPSAFRVNGTVVNVDAFHNAFDTRPCDYLYKAPELRVRIW